MDTEPADVRKRNSCYVNVSPKISVSREECKSDIHLTAKNNSSGLSENQHFSIENRKFHKKYIFDDKPVRNDSQLIDHSFNKDAGQGDKKDSMTNFDLDAIEMKIFQKMSQELQTDDNSTISLDSNIKLFKTAVNQILEKFYTNMQEFELYKKKFHEILQKNRGDTVAEMEDLIKDMIQHIGSSESSMNDLKCTEIKECNIETTSHNNYTINIDNNNKNISNSLNSTIEAFKNENYLTDSTFEQNSSKFNTSEKKENFLNILLLSGTHYVEIKMNNRSLCSEIKIRDQELDGLKKPLASAENVRQLKEKKNKLEDCVKEEEHLLKDKEIPVKSSNARENIHLDKAFVDKNKEECSKFFMFRICNYLCRKFRKNAFT